MRDGHIETVYISICSKLWLVSGSRVSINTGRPRHLRGYQLGQIGVLGSAMCRNDMHCTSDANFQVTHAALNVGSAG
jgi:hypothetical protein